MKFVAHIFGVDGKTTHEITTDSLQEVKMFFDAYDHEGSAIKLNIDANETEVPALLEKVDKLLPA